MNVHSRMVCPANSIGFIISVSPDQYPANEITTDDFDVDESRLISIGPGREYDEQLPYSERQLEAAYESIRNIEEND